MRRTEVGDGGPNSTRRHNGVEVMDSATASVGASAYSARASTDFVTRAMGSVPP
ncbi:MAG: hypothetical protein AB1730_14410 [Myxococcota bacterium]